MNLVYSSFHQSCGMPKKEYTQISYLTQKGKKDKSESCIFTRHVIVIIFDIEIYFQEDQYLIDFNLV